MWENPHRSRAFFQGDKGDREGAQRHTGRWTVINTQRSWFSGPGKQTCTLVATIGKCSACSCLRGQGLGMVMEEKAWKGAAGEWTECSRTHMVDAVPTSPAACPRLLLEGCWAQVMHKHLHTVCLQGTASGSWTVRKQLWELWYKTQAKPHDFTCEWSRHHSLSGGAQPTTLNKWSLWTFLPHSEPFSHTLNMTHKDSAFPERGFYFSRTYIPFLWETPVLRHITCARHPFQTYIEHMVLWVILSCPILSCPKWLSILKF